MTLRTAAVWAVLILAMTLPVGLAALSPWLAFRDPVYIAAGFAGILALSLMLLQPLFIVGRLRANRQQATFWHRVVGVSVLGLVIAHVAGLWLTSPPDVIDVFLLRSPTPFSIWGLIAFVALGLAAVLAALRKRLPLRVWRSAHTLLVCLTVSGTVLHALLIEGTMETTSKIGISMAVVLALALTVYRRRVWASWRR